MFVEQCVDGIEHVLLPGLRSPEVPFKTGTSPRKKSLGGWRFLKSQTLSPSGSNTFVKRKDQTVNMH